MNLNTKQSFSKNKIASLHKSKGDYYAVTSSGYTKLQNVQIESPNPLVTLQPYSRCHYLLPMTKHQLQIEDKSDIKSVHIQDGKSTFFSSNNMLSTTTMINKNNINTQQYSKKCQSQQPNLQNNINISQRQQKRYNLKKMSSSNVIQTNTPVFPKKEILKRSYHEFHKQDQSNNSTIQKKYSLMEQLQKQREKSKKLQENYKKLMKLTNDNDRCLQSQEIQDQQRDSIDKQYTSRVNINRYNIMTASSPYISRYQLPYVSPYQTSPFDLPYQSSARSDKKNNLKKLSYRHHQKTQDCQEEEEYDDMTQNLTLCPLQIGKSLRKTKMLQKARLLKNKDSSSFSSFQGNNSHSNNNLNNFNHHHYKKSIAKCPTAISSSRDNYEYQDKMSHDLEMIMSKLNHLEYEMQKRDEQMIKQRQQRQIRQKQRQIQALQMQNLRIKNLNEMMLLVNKRKEEQQLQMRKQRQKEKERQRQKQKQNEKILAASQNSSSIKNTLFQMNGNSISILLMTILVMLMTSKNIICNN